MDVFARGRPLMRRQTSVCDATESNEGIASSPSPDLQCDPRPSIHFNSSDILSNVEQLGQYFAPLDYNFTSLYGLKILEDRENDGPIRAFSHCPHSVNMSKQLSHILHLYEIRAQLQLYKDCVVWTGQAMTFLKELQLMVFEENEVLQAKYTRKQLLLHEQESRLEYLVNICDELRTNLARWTSVRNRLRLSSALSRKRYQLHIKLQKIRRNLLYLTQCAGWWLHILIQKGIQVFSYSAHASLTERTFWNITRGTEQFGLLLKQNRPNDSFRAYLASHWCQKISRFHITITNIKFPLFKIKLYTLAKFLKQIADIRSELMGELVYDLFTSNTELYRHINNPRTPKIHWNSSLIDLRSKKEAISSKNILETVGISLPDIRDHAITLKMFIEMEGVFALQILNSLATNTDQIRKNPLKNVEKNLRSYKSHDVSLYFQEPPKLDDVSSTAKRAKSVQWRDSKDVTAISFLKVRYLNLLFNRLSIVLYNKFIEPAWRREGFLSLGDLKIQPSVISYIVGDSLHSVAESPDAFEGLLSKTLTHVAFSIESTSSLSETERELLNLHLDFNSVEGTESFMRCWLPAIFICKNMSDNPFLTESSANTDSTEIRLRQNSRSLELLTFSHHLERGCRCYLKCFHRTVSQSLKEWNMHQFLQLTYVHLSNVNEAAVHFNSLLSSILHQTTDRCYLETLTTAFNDQTPCQQLLQSAITESSRQFTLRCKDICHRHWECHFPAFKAWRGKSNQMQNQKPQDYVVHIVSKLLEPVTALSVKLLPRSKQCIAISLAITAIFDSWMDHILHSKTKFSACGAYQLSVDFNYVANWISANHYNLQTDSLRELLQLDSFKQAHAVISLLHDDLPSQSLYSKSSRSKSSETVGYIPNKLITSRPLENGTESCPVSLPHRRPIAKEKEWLSLRANSISCITGFPFVPCLCFDDSD